MKLNQQLKDSLQEELKNLTDKCTAINERRKYNQVIVCLTVGKDEGFIGRKRAKNPNAGRQSSES